MIPHGLLENESSHLLINMLPSEILGFIFEYCLPWPVACPPVTTPAPLVIIRVCSRWRSVAFGTPGLWTMLILGPCVYRIYNLSVIIPYWLRYSYQLPISIVINFPTTVSTEFLGVIRSVRDHLQRCYRLHIIIPAAIPSVSCAIAELIPSPTNMPALLALSVVSPTMFQLDCGTIYAPNLQALSTNFVATLGVPALVPAVAQPATFSGSLRYLNLHIQHAPISFYQLSILLETFPSLKVLDLKVFFLVPSSSTVCVALRSLNTLALRWGYANNTPITSVLEALEVPSLRSLELSCFGFLSGQMVAPRNWEMPNSAGVTDLTLRNMDISSLGHFLSSFESLESLTISKCVSVAVALRSLARDPDRDGPISLLLQQLKIEDGTVDYEEDLFALVKCRGSNPNRRSSGSVSPRYPYTLEVVLDCVVSEPYRRRLEAFGVKFRERASFLAMFMEG